MVSFQCEACGDVLTKKKLDPHRGRCRGASYTCIDCMVHFQGTDYRSHTSCMTEAQKYEGALYKPKPPKGKKQGKNQTDTSKTLTTTNGNSANTKKPRNPYVEDAPDADDPDYKPPPPAPSPPLDSTKAASKPASKPAELAAPAEPEDVNVFDFLVTDQTPTASKVSLGGSKEQMTMVKNAPSVFEPSKALAQYDTDVEDEDREYDVAYEENGFSYGADPIKPSLYENQVSNISMDFMTPAPKKRKEKNRKKGTDRGSPEAEAKTTSDKKRKRGNLDGLDIEAANAREEEDTPMTDAPSSVINNVGTPYLQHSGLTGGLDRMLRDERSSSPGYEDYTDAEDDAQRYQDPQSPLKRTRRNDKSAGSGDNGLGISLKGRAGRIMSMFSGSNVSGSSHGSAEPPSKALVRTRPSSDSGDHHAGTLVHVRKSKKTPTVRHVRTGEPHKTKRKISSQSYGNDHYDSTRPSRRLKAIEYHGRGSDSGGDDNRKMVVYRHHERLTEEEMEREKAAYFLSLVTKGPESTRGCSINKTLKRFHRDFPSITGSSNDHDDESNERDRRGRGHSSRADRDQRAEEEKDLWRTLRLKRNDRGEVVVFF